MSPEIIGILGLVALLVLILCRFWIGASLAIVGFIGIILIRNVNVAFTILASEPYTQVNNYYSWSLFGVEDAVEYTASGVADITILPPHEYPSIFKVNTVTSGLPLIGWPGNVDATKIYSELCLAYPELVEEFDDNGLTLWGSYILSDEEIAVWYELVTPIRDTLFGQLEAEGFASAQDIYGSLRERIDYYKANNN